MSLWFPLKNTLTSGNYLGFLAIPVNIREMFDDKEPILIKFQRNFAPQRSPTFHQRFANVVK